MMVLDFKLLASYTQNVWAQEKPPGPHPPLNDLEVEALGGFRSIHSMSLLPGHGPSAEEEKVARGLKAALRERGSLVLTSLQDLKDEIEGSSSLPAVQELTISGIGLSLDDPEFLGFIRRVAGALKAFRLYIARGRKEDFEVVMRILQEGQGRQEDGVLKVIQLRDLTSLFLPEKFLPVRPPGSSKDLLTFPSVTRLQIQSFPDAPNLLSTICRTFPNLEELEMVFFLNEKPSNFERIRMPKLKFLWLRLDNPLVTELEEFVLTDVQVSCLINLKLRLETFKLTGYGAKCEKLRDFLVTQADCLKELIICNKDKGYGVPAVYSDIILPSPFPLQMTALSVLDVSRSFVANFKELFQSAPNATRMHLEFHPGCDPVPLFPEGEAGSLVELEVPEKLDELLAFWMSPDSISQLGPALKGKVVSLTIRFCYDAVLAAIFKEFGSTLKNLCIFEGHEFKMSDEVFTGLSTAELDQLKKKEVLAGSLGSAGKEEYVRAVDSFGRSPSLADMTALEDLIVCFKANPPKNRMFHAWPFWKLRSGGKLRRFRIVGVRTGQKQLDALEEVSGFRVVSNSSPDENGAATYSFEFSD